MTDIVERLRACHGIQSDDPDCCCVEAADEIEQLRAELKNEETCSSEYEIEIKRLRTIIERGIRNIDKSNKSGGASD